MDIFIYVKKVIKNYNRLLFFRKNDFFFKRYNEIQGFMNIKIWRKKNIVKDVRHIFRLNKLEKETNDAIIKGTRNFFRLEKKKEAIKDKIFRKIKNLFVHQEEDYYNPIRIRHFGSNNYIEYKNKGDRKTPLIEEYPHIIRPHVKDSTNNLNNLIR